MPPQAPNYDDPFSDANAIELGRGSDFKINFTSPPPIYINPQPNENTAEAQQNTNGLTTTTTTTTQPQASEAPSRTTNICRWLVLFNFEPQGRTEKYWLGVYMFLGFVLLFLVIVLLYVLVSAVKHDNVFA